MASSHFFCLGTGVPRHSAKVVRMMYVIIARAMMHGDAY